MADEPVTESSSILDTIKKMLNLSSDYTAFDTEIIVHINSVIFTLNQIGVGKQGFSITDNSQTWEDYLGDTKNLEAVKTCMYMKVRVIFDPPSPSAVLESFNKQISEWEWRLQVHTDESEDKE